jgi:threonine dehydrogenase-like Zn-dependent dehydrogenase
MYLHALQKEYAPFDWIFVDVDAKPDTVTAGLDAGAAILCAPNASFASDTALRMLWDALAPGGGVVFNVLCSTEPDGLTVSAFHRQCAAVMETPLTIIATENNRVTLARRLPPPRHSTDSDIDDAAADAKRFERALLSSPLFEPTFTIYSFPPTL